MSAAAARGVGAAVATVAGVGGPVARADLGVVLPHERVVFDSSWQAVDRPDALGRRLLDRPVTLDVLDALRRDPHASREALVAPADAVLRAELEDLAAHGGATVVDATPPRHGRNPARLRALAAGSGVQIVASACLDQTDHAPITPGPPRRGPDGWLDGLLHEVADGLDGTGVRPGQLLLSGVGWPLDDRDRRALAVVAEAQRRTGLALCVQPPSPAVAYHAPLAQLLVAGGADPRRVLVTGAGEDLDADRLRGLLETGVTLGFDSFGAELRWPSYGGHRTPREAAAAAVVVALLAGGHREQVVVSHGVRSALQLRAFGGDGLRHVPRQVARRLGDLGATDEVLWQVLCETPARLLCG